MGISQFFRRLNCFASAQRNQKSKRQMEKELSSMQELIRILEQDIQITRNTVELFKQRQKVVEEKEKMRRDTRYNLMAQVEEIESELGQALEERKELMSLIIECGIRKTALEKDVQAMEKKAEFFWEDLYDPFPVSKTSAKTWQENLRPVRSTSDLNKAVLKPPLCFAQDADDLQVWDVPYDASDDELFAERLRNEVLITKSKETFV
ncbi:hypothetical protein pdam_00017654 [Pocillopora damicornis]|uniref:Uncharacterized protein n=1 Tax=Pocillopora damicornis TaxID=46731 RepID=A0A3M6THZ3_POCDA|nr:uncharacterized protein LOC113677441 [Pocillopora damicornis]RMX40929.1 hypothetical protein pdam_00017654 [Pocillopora damicornis]